jgi:hypothetical protein
LCDDVDVDDDDPKIMVKILETCSFRDCGEILKLTPGSIVLYPKIIAKMLAGEKIAKILTLADFD